MAKAIAKKPDTVDADEPSISEAEISPTVANKPQADVAETSEEENYLKSLTGAFGITEERPKYPLLQQRQMLYFRLDPVTAAKVIDLLESTQWTQTDAGTLMVKQFLLFSRKGIFTMLLNKNLLESNKIEDLKKIRDMLKPVGADLAKVLEQSIWSKYRKTIKPDVIANARNNGGSA